MLTREGNERGESENKEILMNINFNPERFILVDDY